MGGAGGVAVFFLLFSFAGPVLSISIVSNSFRGTRSAFHSQERGH